MNHHHMSRLCGFALADFAIVSFVTGAAGADERGTWFRSLMMPGTATSCCDIADCHRNEADWFNGQWWAMVDGHWMPIPPNTELTNPSIDGQAYVCSSPATHQIYCFVKPDMAM